MDLPRVNSTRLQRTVADLEFGTEFDSFDALCAAAEKTQWAQNLELDAKTIGQLMVAHGTITKAEKPEASDEPVVADEPAEPVATKPKAKRGKRCPGCDEVVGARSRQCKHCGHDFENRTSVVEQVTADDPAEPDDEPDERSGTVKHRSVDTLRTTHIHTPAGACPHKLEGVDQESVRKWAEKVKDTGESNSKFYGVSALKYYAREFYDIFSDEWKAVSEHLKELYSHEVQR